MRKLSLFALAAVAFLGITSSANASTAMLATDDFVGISFWLVSMGMIATTVFFFAERGHSSCIMENINFSSWISYWCCVRTLYVHERSLGDYR